jgi:2-polyprenyl-6-methoxyphenol hydroxylase-like FAD-dependent oxidoreductase
VVEVSQDDAAVTMDVRGPDGPYRMSARYLVGCDGARSRVRDWAGIGFPGTTYPEVNRLAQVTLPETVTIRGNGDLDVPDFGTIRAGFTRTDRGLFGVAASPASQFVSLYTIEDETTEYDDDTPMTVTELEDSLRRVLGVQLPVGEAIRLSRFTFKARQAERYRHGRILLTGDAAHLFESILRAAEQVREVLYTKPKRAQAALPSQVQIADRRRLDGHSQWCPRRPLQPEPTPSHARQAALFMQGSVRCASPSSQLRG